MTDLQRARQGLTGHSLCLCKGEAVITADGRGISPLLDKVRASDWSGYAAADRIVGKAAALLFCKAGVCAVYGEVMSDAAAQLLESRGVSAEWTTRTPRIINRQGTGPCPMEQAVADVNDPEQAVEALLAKREELRGKAP